MRKVFLVAFALVFTAIGQAQDSAKAKALLEEVYQKVTGYKNIYVDFKYDLRNTEADLNQEARGTVTLEGDKYLAELLGAKLMYDGKKVYTIVPENEEVTIEDKSNDDAVFTPSKLLTFYKNGHTYHWDILQNVQGRKIQYVKLIPMDSNSESKYFLMGIDVETKHIYKVIDNGKNGTTTTFTVNAFKTDQPLSKTLFTFDESKYKADGYYIIKS